MNLLTINSYDCSPIASGGVNRITDILSRQFTKRGINCYLGFFENISPDLERTPFVDRILLNRNFDKAAFKAFLLKNQIDIIQVNFLKKHNLTTLPLIYQIAHECGAKVIYAFHMCPGFQTVTYGSWEMVRYCIKTHANVLTETNKWLRTLAQPVIRLIEPIVLRNKYRIPYDNCDQLITLSSHYFAPYLRLAGIKESNKITAIPNALRFTKSATIEDIQHKQPIALVVARFDEDTKRLSLILKAWRQIEQDSRFADWKLQLVGDGKDRGFYEYLTNKWKLQRIEFTGQQNPQEYYRDASLFLMTSTAEGWGMTLTESMQLGTPCIAMDTFGALQDIITNHQDGIISPANLSLFSQQWMQLMLQTTQRQQMAQHAIEKSQSFTIDIVTNKWLNLFTNILNTNYNETH